MTLQDFINEIMEFCEKETQLIIARLQENRFANQGAFNDNPKWSDNNRKVVNDKGRNEPLVDSGNLKKELTTPENWELDPIKSANILTLHIPDTEMFTDSKYDKLDKGGTVDAYISPRGNFINIRSVPSRKFKDLSDADTEWIKEELINALKAKYE